MKSLRHHKTNVSPGVSSQGFDFFGQSRQINFDLNFHVHGKRRMKKALFYLSVCHTFETALDYIQVILFLYQR